VIGFLAMSHYTALATVAFRVLALFVAVYGILAVLKCLLFIRYIGGSAALAGAVNYGFFAVLGFLLFILSKRLASLAVKGLDHE
jgi:hypothetical protein